MALHQAIECGGGHDDHSSKEDPSFPQLALHSNSKGNGNEEDFKNDKG